VVTAADKLHGLLFCALAVTAVTATSTAWEISGFNDFLKGLLRNLSVTADGVLQPGPAVEWNAALNEPAAWSLAPRPMAAFTRVPAIKEPCARHALRVLVEA
jgi:hypothetical protein